MWREKPGQNWGATTSTSNSDKSSEYLKIMNKSSAKNIWDSLCDTYEGNQQVKEA
jgi:hypothetical protein